MAVSLIGVVGSGIMGGGITEVAAVAGYEVVLRSRELATAESTVACIERSLAKGVAHGPLAEDERRAALARINPTDSLHDLSGCDLVIESVVEDLATKRQLFSELDQICSDKTLLCTNTSTLPVIELARITERPEMVCGIHFFNPAPTMTVVEIVRPATACEETIEQARTFVETCGKKAVVVKDQAGFVVNALLFPYLNSAVRLLEQQVASMEDIDKAMKGGCGFPMGPFAVLDLVGIDTSVAILDALYAEHRDPGCVAVPRLRGMVAAGQLGRKSGRGFYEYPHS
ncbi:MAG: 3-hydroxyacyl-CoA dehydrogenase family protein [Acidimicrobiales bacterium]